jgi:hypothetical protein
MEVSEQIENPIKIKHIVCSGGGITGFSFYGILRESNKAGIWHIDDIETIYGTSVGSIIAIMLTLNYEWDIMDDFLIKRPWQHVFSFNMYSILESLNKRGIFDIKTIEETFLPLFNGKEISIDITMQEFFELTKKEIHIFSTEINTLEIVDISYKTHPSWRVVDAVYASSALPVIFAPYLCEDKCYCDGGFLLNYPLSECLKHHNAEEILGITRTSVMDHSTNEMDQIEINKQSTVSNTSTLLDYIMIIFNKLMKLILKYNTIDIKHEYIVYSPPLSIFNIYNATTSVEERVKLIEIGSNKFQSNYST